MRVALAVEYNGSAYCGWQRQSHSPSVQGAVEQGIARVANHDVQLFCAGRTDTGVHGTNQIVHFDTHSQRENKAWTFGVNAHLPPDIAVKWASCVSDEFHARFSAQARRYRYIIYNSGSRPAILSSGLTWERRPLNVEAMQLACQHFLGEQDFSSVRAASCQSHSKHRNIHHLYVKQKGSYIMVDIQANAFLHHMVRNIVGILLEIGAGRQKPQWAQWVLKQKDRTQSAKTAAAAGLYLVDVIYPEQFQLPMRELGPLFYTESTDSTS